MSNDDQNNGLSQNASKMQAGARLVPRITIQAFCEHSNTAEMIEDLTQDRRMSRVALTTHNGGVEGAIETYKSNPTPNLIIIETSLMVEEIISSLSKLAEVCDSGTQLLVLGHINDVILYRELKSFGVAEYFVLPVSSQILASAISELFASDDAKPIGRSIAFIGAKGGIGSSTIAHNSAWAIANNIMQDVVILDMDIAFGTSGLNFNQDPATGIADALFASETLDGLKLDRIMSKAAKHINLLSASCNLDKVYDFNERSFENIIELCQQSVPIVILDIPHVWNGWVKHTLSMVDEIVIVVEPDLANLRNAKNIIDILKTLRPTEAEPLLIVNKSGVAKRPEIVAQEFADSIECKLFEEIAFDSAVFGTAANNGQMIAEIAKNHKAVEVFKKIASRVSGRDSEETNKKSVGLSIPSLMKLLKRA